MSPVLFSNTQDKCTAYFSTTNYTEYLYIETIINTQVEQKHKLLLQSRRSNKIHSDSPIYRENYSVRSNLQERRHRNSKVINPRSKNKIPWRISDVQCALRKRAEKWASTVVKAAAGADPAAPWRRLSPPPRCLGCRRLALSHRQSRRPPSSPRACRHNSDQPRR